jgi:NAD(P)H dehydrogenase (quinone)
LVKTLSQIESVSAFVHREEQRMILKSLGAEKVIVGDMREKTVMNSVMQGIRAVYHLCPNMSPDEVAIGRSVIDAARKNGIEHLVYHSVLHPQIEAMPHHWDKLRVEEMIFKSGLPFTILQPAPYMQNLLGSWKAILEEEILRVPYSVDTKFSFVDLEDVVQAANTVLMNPDHQNAVYELAGTLPLSHTEVAEVFGRVLKCSIRAEKQKMSDWKSGAGNIGKYALENLIAMFEYYDQFGLAGNPTILKSLLGRKPTSIEESASKAATQQGVSD